MNIKTKAIFKSIDEKKHTLDCIMTAEIVDRHGEIVDVDSMDFKDFLNNPVVLASHDYDDPSVGKVIDIRKTLSETGIKQIECTIEFAVNENPKAKIYFDLYKGGFMSAFSIGFTVANVDVDGETGVRRLMNCKMLEISCVTVPVNQLALAKSKGIDVGELLKSIPEQDRIKAGREMIILGQELLNASKILSTETVTEQKAPEEVTPEATETPKLDNETKTDILRNEAEIKKERAKLLISKAIRLLK